MYRQADLWPIVFALPTLEAQRIGRDALRGLLLVSENGSLLAAAAEGSLGPVARGAKILKEGSAILDGRPTEEQAQEAWQLRVEGVAREIDATFTKDSLPAELRALRDRVVATLNPAATETGAI